MPAKGNHRACENAPLTTNGYRHPLFMTVLTTQFFAVSDAKPHACWRLTRFNLIARYVERMLSHPAQSADPAAC